MNSTTEIDTEYEGECDKTCQQIIGIVFVLVGEVSYVAMRHDDTFYWYSSFLLACGLFIERKC